MFALIFGAFFIISCLGYIISFLGFVITSGIKYSTASHLIWGVAFIIFAVCLRCAFGYHLGFKFLLLK